jgi:dihydroorotate dehydrogenase electron transfer subunit
MSIDQTATISERGRFFHGRVTVERNDPQARDTFLIRLKAPALAAAIRPGQFLMIRMATGTDPLLGRPFALYDTVLDENGRPTSVDIVYLVVGKLTGLLAALKPGAAVEVWGPLGNGFPDLAGLHHVALVAGGIGQTPFLAHVRDLLGRRGYGGLPARQQVQRVSIYYGVRTTALVAGVEDFRAAGATVHVTTDDGSLGARGFVTSLLEQHLAAASESYEGLPPQHLIGCGPEPMLRALRKLAHRWRLPCHLSLETPMACGVGICFSCVAPIKSTEGWDFKRVCVDGPIFAAATLAWDEDEANSAR